MTYLFDVPDLPGALCRKPDNMKVFDATYHKGTPCHKDASNICGKCPAKPECGKWVLENETPTGSWGGVWAGMTPGERKRVRSAMLAKGLVLQ